MAAVRIHMPTNPVKTSSMTRSWMEWVEITPDLAQGWLENTNTANRPLNERRVHQMAHDLQNGNWRETPDLIAFDINGVLVNGQHRLTAIVKADQSIFCWVMKGLSTESFHVTDDVKRRSFGDYLAINDVANHTNISALVRLLHTWETSKTLKPQNQFIMGTTSDLIQWFDDANQDELQECVKIGERLSRHAMANRTALSFCFWHFRQIDFDDAEAFEVDVTSGDGPGRVFREAMLRDRASVRPTISRDVPTVCAYLIKAWNAYRLGEDLKLLRYRPGGANPEKFPLPV